MAFADEKKFEDCRQKLIASQKLDLLYDLQWTVADAANPKVVVGPTYHTVPFTTKEKFATTVNCFLMQGKEKHINFNITDWRTGKVVGRYEYGQLKPL